MYKKNTVNSWAPQNVKPALYMCMCLCVCVYVCIHICMYVCMSVCVLYYLQCISC